jgi:anti-sigma factor RsiW
MSADLPDPRPPAPLSCDAFRERVHQRNELPAAERRAFERHASGCRACTRLLLEVEQLDDLLLQWRAPEPASGPIDEKIVRALQGDGPTASCAEATASLHHFVGGDLEPWLAARVERHLVRCDSCRDHLDEVQHSRKVWLAWRAPDPPEALADRIVRRLEPATRAARRRRRLFELMFGAVAVPRVAAALVLASLTLLAVGVLRARIGGPTGHPMTQVDPPPNGMTDSGHGPGSSSTFQTTRFETPAGRSDATDSFSPSLRPGEKDSLRRALRGH